MIGRVKRQSGSEATKRKERGSDGVRTPFLHYVNTGVSRSKIFGVGEYPSGTFRFKKIDGSFWNGETFRFADYRWKIFFEENAKKVMKKFVDTKIMHTFVMISNVICKQL